MAKNTSSPRGARGNSARGNGRDPKASFAVPGLDVNASGKVAAVLQERLVALIDLALTLKHIHWNVVGPNFIAVHEMLDPQVAGVQDMVDTTAERIATLGVPPNGLIGYLDKTRTWDDYALGRAMSIEHLGALDVVYVGVIEAHRKAADAVEDLDLVTQDMLVGQLGDLEQYHWFVRAHLESDGGELSTAGAHTETEAARSALKASAR